MKSKLPHVGDTVFAEMTSLADSYDAINLSQGFPNFGASDRLVNLVSKHMETGKNQYPPMRGVPTLRKKIADKLEALYEVELDFESEITVTAGATQAIQMAITALIHPGDEVVVFDPAYDVYDPCIRLNGGTPHHLKLRPPSFNIDWEQVDREVGDQTKMIVINTPHNPTATVMRREDMVRLAEIAEKYDLWVLSDEVYQHMVYDEIMHQSALSFPSLRKRCLTAFSFGKTYHVTGWKVGYLVAPPEITAEFRKVFQYGMFAVSSPMQYAFGDYLDYSQEYLQLSSFYEEKRDFFRTMLEESRFNLLPCEGTYYQCVSFDNISDEPDTRFVKKLIKNHGVAAIPISPFYANEEDHRIIRFCFAKKEETLREAGEKLLAI